MFQVIEGDCLDVLKTMPDCSVDAIVTDPPAGIAFMGKDWDKDKGGRDNWIKWMSEVAAECYRVIKPGGHALVWALPRTSHWTGMAWENGGWEPRDKFVHLFGTGFPKSLDISKQIDKLHGAEREVVGKYQHPDGSGERKAKAGCGLPMKGSLGEWNTPITKPATPDAEKWDGFGTALKPAHEDWWLFRKPLAEKTVAENVLKHGTGGLNIGATRIGIGQEDSIFAKNPHTQNKGNEGGWCTSGGNGSGYNIPAGRWPANVVLTCSCEGDHSESCPVSQFPETKSGGSGERSGLVPKGWKCTSKQAVSNNHIEPNQGSAARFFYTAKASKRDRDEGLENLPKTVTDDGRNKSIDNPYQRGETLRHNPHPTVKATPLMRWLCRLICPPGGVILDPFCGSGSTGKGAIPEGFKFIGIEQDPESVQVARARIAWAAGEPAPTLPPSAENEEPETAVTAPERPKQLSLFGV